MSKGYFLLLSSGVALGAYIPPLVMHYQLKRKGINTLFYVIENLIYDKKIDNILNNKSAFHKSFKVALTGQKLSSITNYGIDFQKVDCLFTEWDNLNIVKILVFSGFWCTIIEKYIETRRKYSLDIDHIHLDSSLSTSWKNWSDNYKARDIWFFNLSEKKVNYHLQIANRQLINYKNRNPRYVIHGGGWGMGTYRDQINYLNINGIKLDIINYENGDLGCWIKSHRYFLIDPVWQAWTKYNSVNIFPPFSRVKKNLKMKFDYSNTNYPQIYDLIRSSLGIISKPGGATLIDSFASATPVILLEPFGKYEENNALLWEELGFGMNFDHWASSGFCTHMLSNLHEKLLANLSHSQNIIDLYV